jgi:beta-aspartyl-peptidase (threonine type)
MGTLEFRNLEVRLIGDRAAMVLGNFHLTQGEKVSEGGFTLVLEKFDEGWRIIHDHSSAKEESEKKDD